MRAFIEYPEAGSGRIEITEEVAFRTQDIRTLQILEDAGYFLPEGDLRAWLEDEITGEQNV